MCNSAVRDRSLLAELKPDLIAFSDPVFHFGPSRYARAFRDDLLVALSDTGALALTTDLFVEPLVAHIPSIADKLIVVTITHRTGWQWPSQGRMVTRATGNVLTNLMLPVAFALADDIAIAGCDGRRTNESYFWKHNPQVQYGDSLMQTAFDAHPAFFRDRNYVDYYERHCAELEELVGTAEAAGKRVVAVTPSHIPALQARGATAPAAG